MRLIAMQCVVWICIHSVTFCSALLISARPSSALKLSYLRVDPLHLTATTVESANAKSSDSKIGSSDHAESSELIEYRQLYSKSACQRNETIETRDGSHRLYFEVHSKGPLNALFLHGGPGAGCFPNHARFFDPKHYSIVLLDQRGAGRSSPKASVVNNTLSHLVDDCDLIREHLAIDRWDVVLGGSWGTTLGLAYAQTYPNSMRCLILRGICTLRPTEVDWLFNADTGSALRFPKEWNDFSKAVLTESSSCNNQGRDVLYSYYDRLMLNTAVDNNDRSNVVSDSSKNSVRLAAAKSWMMWEMSVTSSYTNKAQKFNDKYRLKENVVIVSRPGHSSWYFENHSGERSDDASNLLLPEDALNFLREGLESEKSSPTYNFKPVRSIEHSNAVSENSSNDDSSPKKSDGNNNNNFRLPPDYVPAQAMLTCFYSVNDRYVMSSYENLSSKESCHRFHRDLQIIGIHGGSDPICPLDTAVALKSGCDQAKIKMELRIPVLSGHSMYDLAITHELIEATDKIASKFLSFSR